MSAFGSDDPREMPPHFFWGALRLDYRTAVRAETTRQNCSMCPRYWYVDAHFRCERCGAEFAFSAAEQRVWYEDYGFWVDAFPKHCPACRGRFEPSGRRGRSTTEMWREPCARVTSIASGGWRP